MSAQIQSFAIKNLWGSKDFEIKMHDNRLILVGENGSGKTTILRILYETLACKWTELWFEEFGSI